GRHGARGRCKGIQADARYDRAGVLVEQVDGAAFIRLFVTTAMPPKALVETGWAQAALFLRHTRPPEPTVSFGCRDRLAWQARGSVLPVLFRELGPSLFNPAGGIPYIYNCPF